MKYEEKYKKGVFKLQILEKSITDKILVNPPIHSSQNSIHSQLNWVNSYEK